MSAVLSKIIFNKSDRPNIFKQMTELDFIDQEEILIFNEFKDYYDHNGDFESQEFLHKVTSQYGHIVKATKTIADTQKAIEQQKQKAGKHRIHQKLISSQHVITDPSTTFKQVQEICKDIYDLAENKGFYQEPLKSRKVLMSETLEHIQKVSQGLIKYKTFGLPGLENVLFEGGDLVVLGARASTGKTAIGLDCCRHSAIRGQASAFICLETDDKTLNQRLISQQSLIPFSDIRNGLMTAGQLADLDKAAQQIIKLPLKIISKYNQTIEDIRRLCKSLKDQGYSVVYIDYLQKIREPRHSRNRFDAVGYISGELKNIANELDITIVALTQLNRDTGEGSPKMTNLAESSKIEQDATIIMLIDRPDIHNPPAAREYHFEGRKITERDMRGRLALIIAKNRNGKTGLNFYDYDFSCFKILKESEFGQPR